MNTLPLRLGIWTMAGRFLTLSKYSKVFTYHDHESLDQICTKIFDKIGGIVWENDGSYSKILQLSKACMDAWVNIYNVQKKMIKEARACKIKCVEIRKQLTFCFSTRGIFLRPSQHCLTENLNYLLRCGEIYWKCLPWCCKGRRKNELIKKATTTLNLLFKMPLLMLNSAKFTGNIDC